jgi:hypothetical protein
MAIAWRIVGKFTYGSDPTEWDELYFDNSVPEYVLLKRVYLNCDCIEQITSRFSTLTHKLEGVFISSEGAGQLFQGAGISSVKITTECSTEFTGNPAEVTGTAIRLTDTADHIYFIPTAKIVKIEPIL